MKSKIAIIGGGVAGMYCAHLAQSQNPRAEVHLFERSSSLGGLLTGHVHFDNETYFDSGTHILRETGYAEIDSFFQSAIETTSLIRYPRGEGDRSGAIIGGRLDKGSHFPDLAKWPDAAALGAEFASHIDQLDVVPDWQPLQALNEVAGNRFGERVSLEVIGPIIQKLYGLSLNEAAGFALSLVGITRLRYDDSDRWVEQVGNDIYRALHGVPDQRDLPEQYLPQNHSYYSSDAGASSIVKGAETLLREQGVNIHTSCHIDAIDLSQRQISFSNSGNQSQLAHFDFIVMANGTIGAALTCGLSLADFELERPRSLHTIDLISQDLVDCDLCYYYGYDQNTPFYRVTNYQGFSQQEGDKRLTIEVIGVNGQAEPVGKEALLTYLTEVGILSAPRATDFAIQEVKAGYPVPSVKNLNALSRIRNTLVDTFGSDLVMFGLGAKEGLFLQNDVLVDIHRHKSLF